MNTEFLGHMEAQLAHLRNEGLYKEEWPLEGPQGARIRTGGREVLNFCANNYLGLGNHPVLRQAAEAAMDDWGFGLASVRFICGTQTIHQELEQRLARFLGQDDAILFSSCFDANGGLFEALLGPEDAIVSDSLNHASLIDGIRLCKARRYRYQNGDMEDLSLQLRSARQEGARFVMLVTDGVFSMDGFIAPLDRLADLADQHGAVLVVDDSHAVGFVGQGGRGSPEFHCVQDRVGILTGTLGKALGGASGGYVAGPSAVISLLRQKARPYLFSNTLAPPLVAAALAALDIVEGQEGRTLRTRLGRNAARFRTAMEAEGFVLQPGVHPIVPVMLGDAALAVRLASRLLELGVYVRAFSFPVVPRGQARIRTQMSAAHSDSDVDRAVGAFVQAGRELGITGGKS